jgi:adenylate cyclase
MESDWHNASMLISCYRETGDRAQMRRAAERTVERTEKAIATDPSNSTVLAAGVTALAAIGEDQRAKDWIDRALLLDPDNNIMRYNLACALTTDLNDLDRAIEVLEPYFRTTLGVTHIRHAEIDPDLDPVRDDPRFKQLLAEARERLGMSA